MVHVHLASATVMNSNKGSLLEWVHCHSNGQLIKNSGYLHYRVGTCQDLHWSVNTI